MSNVNPAITTIRSLKSKLDGLIRDVVKAGDSFKSTEQEDEETALSLLQGKLSDLEFALVKMSGTQRMNDAEKATIMAKIDSNRRDLLAAARECTPHVSSAGKDVVASVVNFARLKDTTEVISPRDFGVEWKTPAKSEATRNDLKRLSICSVTSSVRSEPLSHHTPQESEGSHTGLTQRQMAVMELEKKEKAIKESEAARLKSTPIHNPGSQRAAALEELQRAQAKAQKEAKSDQGDKPTPTLGTSQRAAAMKQLASSLTGPAPPAPPPSLAAMRAQMTQAPGKAPPKPPTGSSVTPVPPLRKAVVESDVQAQSIFAESRRTTQESLCNLESARAPPQASQQQQQPAGTAHLTLAERMAAARNTVAAPNFHAPASSIEVPPAPPPLSSFPHIPSAYDRYRSTGGSSGGGAPPPSLPPPAPPLPTTHQTSMGGSSDPKSHPHHRQQQLSAAMEAALPTLHSLRLADPRRSSGGGSSVNGPAGPAPLPPYSCLPSRPQSLGGYLKQPALIHDYRFNVDEEEEEGEFRTDVRRRGSGWMRKVWAGVGSVVTLALVTGGAVLVASLLNTGCDEHSSRRSNALLKRERQAPVSKDKGALSPLGPPYLPNAPFVFRG